MATNHHMKKFLLSLAALTAAFVSHAQSHRCGTMDVHNRLLQTDNNYGLMREVIDQHIQHFQSTQSEHDVNRVVYTIPVVFHVVYQNATENISDAQLLSQIDVLNDDFRRLNSNFSSTPSVFQGVAADVEIEFCLASVDPTGNPTTGITRTQTTVSSFNTNDNVKFTSTGGRNAWPRASYLNIWVADLGNSLLGYAQFPGGPANTDGVVLTYTSVGRPPANTFGGAYNLGRTATHEVGHWLGLYHIWGDDGNGCNGTDEVADTPNQADETTGCPSFPQISCSNGPNGDMFMNYMDYMSDACATMFTNGQKTRMRSFFAPGGARASLLNSTACTSTPPPPPPSACNDTLRFPLSGTEAIYGSQEIGYVAGTNTYNDSAKVDKFTATAPFTLVKGGFFKFADADLNGLGSYNVTFRLYDDNGTGGLPGTILASTTVPMSTVINSVTNDAYLQVQFPNAVAVSGAFYLGVVINPASGVILALYTNQDGQSTPNTAFEQFEDGSWHEYTEEASWGISVSHAISAWMEVPPPTASFSVSAPNICSGSNVTYTSTGVGASTYQWTFPGGNPSSSTAANPTVAYNTAGTYNATLLVTSSCQGQTATVTQNNVVVVGNQPATPAITNVGGTLQTTISGGSVQWFLNGVAIPGATGLSHFPTAVGNYTVTVTQGGCSATSAPFPVTTVDVNALMAEGFVAFPNPANEKLYVKSGFQTKQATLVTLTDLSGKQVLLERFSAEGVMEISTRHLAAGMYLLSVSNGSERQVVRIGITH